MFANKTGNRWKRLLAALLTVCLCLAAAPFSAFAVPNEEEPEGGSQTEDWKELTDRRELASRTFLSEDGSEVVALYPYPIFYQDGEDGGLVPYDYRMELVSGEEDAKEYRVRDGSMESSVRRFFSGGEFLRLGLDEGERTVAFSLPTGNSVRAKLPEFKVQAGLYEGGTAQGAGAEQSRVAAEQVRNYRLCEDALSGIDVGVEQWPGNVKVSAVFEKVSRAKEGLVLSAAFDGLTMEESPSGSLRLFAAGKEVAVLEAPVIYDGKGAVGKASYMLSPREDGAMQILVKPDDEWMEELSRTSPVTVEMCVTQTGMEEGISTGIQGAEGYFGGVPVAVGNTRETVQTQIALPPLPALSEGKAVERVRLVLGRATGLEEAQNSLELGVYRKLASGETEKEPMDSAKYEKEDKADVCMFDVTDAYGEGASKDREVVLKSVQTELVTGVYGFDFFAADMLLPMLLVGSEVPEEAEGDREYIIVGEDTERRDPFTRHYLLEDGSTLAAVYEVPVHYRKDGRWAQIDNTLILDEAEGVYRNRASDFSASFAKESDAKDLVELTTGDGSCSWTFLEGEAGKGFSPESGTEAEETSEGGRYLELSGSRDGKSVSAYNAEQMKVQGITGGGTYSDVLEQVDIRYVLDSAQLRESILLGSKEAAETPIRFLVSHPGLEMSLAEDGSAVLKRAGETVYTFAAPYMYDWAGNFSGEVRFRLEKESESETILHIEPDTEWLKESGRTYPVALERAVEPEGRRAVQTAFVREKQPGERTEEAVPLPVGVLSGYGISRTFLRFSHLPELAYGERITRGLLNLYQSRYISKRSTDFAAGAYPVLEDWDETVTWDSQPSVAEAVLDSQQAEALKTAESGTLLALKQFDVTGRVGSWYGEENNGLMIASLKEGVKAGAGYTISNRSTRSDPYPQALYPAGLFYYQRETNGKKVQNVREQEASQAGTGYVGAAGGSLVFVHEDLDVAENRLPGGLSHVYGLDRLAEGAVYGNGWGLNVEERLETTGLSALPYLYIDADGDEHFLCPEEGEENRKRDVEGLGLTLTETGSGERFLSGEDGSERLFDAEGVLLQKKEADGTELFYSYGDEGRLVGLSDAAGLLVSLSYDETDGRLLSLTDETTGKTISYQYDFAGNLTGVLHPDGKRSTYDYDERRLIRARAADGTAVEYFYGTAAGCERVSMTRTWKGGSAESETFSYGER